MMCRHCYAQNVRVSPVWWCLEVGPLGGDSVEMRSWEWSPHDLLSFSHSVVSDSSTPWTAACKASLSFTSPGVCLDSCPLNQWCHPTISSSLSSPSPPALNLSQLQGLFQRVGSLHQVAKKYWSFSFSVSPSEYSGLISFRIDWFDLLTVQGLSGVFSSTTVQKHHVFGAQPSLQSDLHLYMTTGKTIVLTGQTFVGKVMPLLFNTMGWVNLEEEETEISAHTKERLCEDTARRQLSASWEKCPYEQLNPLAPYPWTSSLQNCVK